MNLLSQIASLTKISKHPEGRTDNIWESIPEYSQHLFRMGGGDTYSTLTCLQTFTAKSEMLMLKLTNNGKTNGQAIG